jgi:hypothetical protein
MSQRLTLGWIKAAGIVPVLFGMGFFMYKFEVMRWLGAVVLIIAAVIGISYAILGLIGILQRMEIIEIKTTEISLDMIFKRRRK